MIAECRRLFPSQEFKVADGDSIDAAGESIDLVLSIGVLEYLADPVGHLKELAQGHEARREHYRNRPERKQSLETARSADPRADRFAARKVAAARYSAPEPDRDVNRSGPSSRIRVSAIAV